MSKSTISTFKLFERLPNEANAALISTAPEGLALAELIIASHQCGFINLTKGDWQAIIDAARALKSKAGGSHE